MTPDVRNPRRKEKPPNSKKIARCLITVQSRLRQNVAFGGGNVSGYAETDGVSYVRVREEQEKKTRGTSSSLNLAHDPRGIRVSLRLLRAQATASTIPVEKSGEIAIAIRAPRFGLTAHVRV